MPGFTVVGVARGGGIVFEEKSRVVRCCTLRKDVHIDWHSRGPRSNRHEDWWRTLPDQYPPVAFTVREVLEGEHEKAGIILRVL